MFPKILTIYTELVCGLLVCTRWNGSRCMACWERAKKLFCKQHVYIGGTWEVWMSASPWGFLRFFQEVCFFSFYGPVRKICIAVHFCSYVCSVKCSAHLTMNPTKTFAHVFLQHGSQKMLYKCWLINWLKTLMGDSKMIVNSLFSQLLSFQYS